MSETKGDLPMTVPEFVYDETKDPIEQLQNYIFENKLLFDFYLEDIKDTKLYGNSCGSSYDVSFLEEMKADFLICLKYSRVKDQSGNRILGYVLYFKHSVVIVEKDLNPYPNQSTPRFVQYQTEKIDHYYDLSNLTLNDLIDVVYGHDGRITNWFKPRYPTQNNISGHGYVQGSIIGFYNNSKITDYMIDVLRCDSDSCGGQCFNPCKNLQKPPVWAKKFFTEKTRKTLQKMGIFFTKKILKYLQ